MDPDQLHRVRSFNRTVTQRIGALNDHFLGRGRPLGESRLLYEIGHSGAEIRHLRAQLELDSGYVSRLLRSLERQGLVQAEAGPKDGRVRRVRLTREGMTEVVELGRRSDAFATSVLAPLSAVQRGSSGHRNGRGRAADERISGSDKARGVRQLDGTLVP